MRFMLMVKAGANYEAGRPPDPVLLAAIGALGRPLAPHELAILLPWGSEQIQHVGKRRAIGRPTSPTSAMPALRRAVAQVRAVVACCGVETGSVLTLTQVVAKLGRRAIAAIPTTAGFI